ncbi:vWA domain-containing protein [Tomitella biformata]|uniref:vWA domain-containing protein n=1 Tax=Tomitella biformata TaxID=630403 RepID=UPI0004B434F2|nr:VWA domain-containing protein [Tomitella biformata]
MPQHLSRGQNAPLAVSEMIITVSASAAVDVSALLVTEAGIVRSDQDFVFYNQPAGPGVHLQPGLAGAPASLAVDLAAIPAEIAQVRAIITLADATSSFGRHSPPVTHLRDPAGTLLFEYRMDGLDTESIVIAVDLYRRDGAWKVRAVGQGYAGGFAALVTDHGVAVDDGPAPDPTAAPAAPAMALPTGTLDRLPVDMRKRLDLRKKQVAVSLQKHGGDQLKARIVLVLDASGSMGGLYAKGIVGGIVERMAAVAAHLDDDGAMQAFTFASHSARLPDLELSDLPEWIRLHVRVGQLKLFGGRAKNLEPGQVDMRAVGIQNEEQKVIADVRALVAADPQSVPTLVLFFSDGGVHRNQEIEEQLRAAVAEPIFWQFIGLGRAGFGVLEKFDNLTDRLVDNVGFFSVDQIDEIPDAELYDRLLSEFPAWTREARRHRIID